jgi:hypothetical protein
MRTVSHQHGSLATWTVSLRQRPIFFECATISSCRGSSKPDAAPAAPEATPQVYTKCSPKFRLQVEPFRLDRMASRAQGSHGLVRPKSETTVFVSRVPPTSAMAPPRGTGAAMSHEMPEQTCTITRPSINCKPLIINFWTCKSVMGFEFPTHTQCCLVPKS